MFASRFEFSLGPRIIYARGLAASVGVEGARLGARRALLVADTTLHQAGLLETLKQSIAAELTLAAVFDRTPPNSSLEAVEAGVALAREARVDAVIAVGGGSTIDTAKAIRLLLAAGGSLVDWLGGLRLTGPLPPLIAMPTTAGTGSEVSPAIHICDQSGRRRLRLSNPALLPTLALLDPQLTFRLPPLLTAATGMHALSHAIEAFVSTATSPFADSMALYAIDLIASYLRDATHTPDDGVAREAMLVASTMAGLAFVNAGPGIVGAMAEAIGSAFDIHPGAVHSILLPFGMQFNSVAVPNRYQRIARVLGIVAGGRPEVDVIGDSVTEVRSMSADCNLPLRLRDVGIATGALDGLAEVAAADEALRSNPRPAAAAEIKAIFDEAW